MQKKYVIPALLVVALLMIPLAVGASHVIGLGYGYGYGAPPAFPTSTFTPTPTEEPVVQEPAQVIELPSPTPTATPAGSTTGRMMSKGGDTSIAIGMMESPIWDEPVKIVNVLPDENGMLVPPIGTVGQYGSTFVCHLDFVEEGTEIGRADICLRLVELKSGDEVKINGESWTVVQTVQHVSNPEWPNLVSGTTTLSSCQPWSWDDSQYTERVVVFLERSIQ